MKQFSLVLHITCFSTILLSQKCDTLAAISFPFYVEKKEGKLNCLDVNNRKQGLWIEYELETSKEEVIYRLNKYVGFFNNNIYVGPAKIIPWSCGYSGDQFRKKEYFEDGSVEVSYYGYKICINSDRSFRSAYGVNKTGGKGVNQIYKTIIDLDGGVTGFYKDSLIFESNYFYTEIEQFFLENKYLEKTDSIDKLEVKEQED